MTMTFKDLAKIVGLQNQQYSNNPAFSRLKGLPFWHWDVTQHRDEYVLTNGTCCFQHVLGFT
jgi:hypothetical protein